MVDLVNKKIFLYCILLLLLLIVITIIIIIIIIIINIIIIIVISSSSSSSISISIIIILLYIAPKYVWQYMSANSYGRRSLCFLIEWMKGKTTISFQLSS